MTDTPLVECVPNFSEGRDPRVIESIFDAMDRVPGASVLHVDSGASAHRTVMTVLGDPAAVQRAAFEGIRTASELIDMRRHRGVHARMGATDVCPIVPVRGIDLETCAALARELADEVGDALGIPVYLYGAAANRPERRELARVRAGEYEGLEARLAGEDSRPDVLPHVFNARAGATAISARPFLVAFNVNLNTDDRRIAHDIALSIREQGRARRDAVGKIVRDAEGRTEKVPGRLPGVRAVGWVIEEFGCAQVSCNLVDHETSGLHDVFDACREEAEQRGVRVTGSELIGLVPASALRASGEHYLRLAGASTALPESHVHEMAVRSLGLSELETFETAERILDAHFPADVGVEPETIGGFLEALSTAAPTPGGGSVGGLLGALGAALVSMVGNLTVGKPGAEAVSAEAEELAAEAQGLRVALQRDVARDMAAFEAYMAAPRKPASDEERAIKEAAVRGAIGVPAEVLERCLRVVQMAGRMREIGNAHAVSDAACAASAAVAAAECSMANVVINLPALSRIDAEAARQIGEAARQQLAEVRSAGRAVVDAYLDA